MLNINNPEDKIKMMNYHRTRDMINLLTFFPNLSPIRNLTIVESVEDYQNNFEFCKNFSFQRNDTLITKPSMKSIEVADSNPMVVKNTLEKVKKLDKDGVMVLFDLCHEPSERYERYAGISVGVSLGRGIYIDSVGKGFDGREVSKGLSSHERYYIPWFELRTCNIGNFKKYRTYLISDEEYEKSRNARIEFLISLGLNYDLLNKCIPEKYVEIPDFIWLDVIKNLIKKIENMEEELSFARLDEFAISGHTEGKKFLPWQIFDKHRYTLIRKINR